MEVLPGDEGQQCSQGQIYQMAYLTLLRFWETQLVSYAVSIPYTPSRSKELRQLRIRSTCSCLKCPDTALFHSPYALAYGSSMPSSSGTTTTITMLPFPWGCLSLRYLHRLQKALVYLCYVKSQCSVCFPGAIAWPAELESPDQNPVIT